MEILKLLSDKFPNIRITDVTNHDPEKIDKVKYKLEKVENVIMYCSNTENTKKLLEKYYSLNEFINKGVYNSIDEISNYNFKISLSKNIKFSDKIIEATNNSNINELNNEFYKDMILNKKPKKKKFNTEIITTSVDLNKDLNEDYLNYCKNTELKKEKISKIKHISIPQDNSGLIKYKPIDKNYIAVLFHRNMPFFLYENMNMETLIKDIDDWINKKFNIKTNHIGTIKY